MPARQGFGMVYESPQGPGTGAAIDMAQLARQTLGDTQLQREVLALFTRQIEDAAMSLKKGNATERRRIAHGLKGTARSLGANRLAACAEQIEAFPEEDRFVADMAAAVRETVVFIAKLAS